MNYCISAVGHEGHQPVVLLRGSGSPGCLNCDLHLVCIVDSGSSPSCQSSGLRFMCVFFSTSWTFALLVERTISQVFSVVAKIKKIISLCSATLSLSLLTVKVKCA
ncbi:hypothetical protein GOODEAATRI_021246 [Goodea atripinnis]|uniref:Uncharacterized protein n=1 Tax=Goodea atripinnis TaxID=208336 RepID=A0ABV0MJP9_9TELE